MVQALRSVQWASANKSGLATIFANPTLVIGWYDEET